MRLDKTSCDYHFPVDKLSVSKEASMVEDLAGEEAMKEVLCVSISCLSFPG